VINGGQTVYTGTADETWRYKFGMHGVFASVTSGPVVTQNANDADDRVTIFSRPDDSPPRSSPKRPARRGLPATGASRFGAMGDCRNIASAASSPKNLSADNAHLSPSTRMFMTRNASDVTVLNSPKNARADNGNLSNSTTGFFMQSRSDFSRHATPLDRRPDDRRPIVWNEVACSVSSVDSSQDRAEYAIPTPPPTPPVPVHFVEEGESVAAQFAEYAAYSEQQFADAGCHAVGQQTGLPTTYSEASPLDTQTTLSPNMATTLTPGAVLQTPVVGSVDMGEPQFQFEAVFQYKCPVCDFLSPSLEEAANHCAGCQQSRPFHLTAMDGPTNPYAAYAESSDPFHLRSMDVAADVVHAGDGEAAQAMGVVDVTPKADDSNQDVEYNKYACPVCGFLTPDFDLATTHCAGRASCHHVLHREASSTSIMASGSRDATPKVGSAAANQAEGIDQDFEYNKYECPVCGFLTPDFNEATTHCAAGRASVPCKVVYRESEIVSSAVDATAETADFAAEPPSFLTADFNSATTHCGGKAMYSVGGFAKPSLGGAVYGDARAPVDVEFVAEHATEHAAPTSVFADAPVWGPPVMAARAQSAVDIPFDSQDVGGSSTQVGRYSAEYESPSSASQSQAPMMQKPDHLPHDADGQNGVESPIAGLCSSDADAEPVNFCAVNYRCPKCSVLLPSFDAAVNHCADNLQASRTTTPTHAAEPAEGPELFRRSSGPVYAAQEGSSTASTAYTADAGRSSPKSYAPPDAASPQKAAAAPLEVDSEPTLMKQYDPETGRHKTIVRNADGSKKAFGWRTVISLVENNEDETMQWMNSLTETELKGLLSEVTDHVSEGAKNYMSKKAEVEKLNLQVSYAYFGLSADADEKELDNAYRKLARRMHPDKNGGTEDAKQKFQNMKAHYEALKQGRLEANKENQENRESQQEMHEEDCDETSGEKSAPQESDQGQQGQQNQQGQKGMGLLELLQSNDRGALDQAVMEMRAQLKTIRQHMDILASEQQRLSASMGSRAS